MIELGKRIGRRELLKAVGFSLVGLGAVVACGESANVAPPEGFTRNPDDYRFKIIIDRGSSENVAFYTNNQPTLTSNSGQNHLIAEDVYCPNLSDWEKENFGCEEFVQGEYELSQPKRIIVVPNKPSDSR